MLLKIDALTVMRCADCRGNTRTKSIVQTSLKTKQPGSLWHFIWPFELAKIENTISAQKRSSGWITTQVREGVYGVWGCSIPLGSRILFAYGVRPNCMKRKPLFLALEWLDLGSWALLLGLLACDVQQHYRWSWYRFIPLWAGCVLTVYSAVRWSTVHS